MPVGKIGGLCCRTAQILGRAATRPDLLLCRRSQTAATIAEVKSIKPILEISDLRIQRDETVILDGVNWRVEAGEHWAILGANGSGKTSLLSALTGYLMPTAGEISMLGEIYGQSDWRELRKKVGLVSSSVRQMMTDDEPALETVASGKYAMIDFWGRVTSAEKAQATKLLRQVECEYLAGRIWRVLSQGERQRVLVARALMAKPHALILDEPCTGLDPAAREHFLQFLQRLGKRKNAPTLVLVTHHVEEIMPVFSRMLILKNGRVLAAGKKPDVLNAKNLSRAFGARMRLQQTGNRYALTVTAKSRGMM
jgi:iron complex transport system ATP-binding protein